MKCMSCGTVVSLGTLNCPNCGAKIRDEILERAIPVFRRPKTTAVAPMNSLHRLVNIYVRPSHVYLNYVISPDNLGPFTIFITTILLSSLFYPAFMIHFPVTDFMDSMGLFIMVFTAWFGIFIFDFVMNVLLTLGLVVLYYFAIRLTGVKARLGDNWGITLYATAPLIIARLLCLGIIVAIPIPGATPISIYGGFAGLGLLLLESPQWAICRLIERVFFVWVGLLAAIGFRERYQLGVLQSIIAVAVATVFFLGLSLVGLAVPLEV